MFFIREITGMTICEEKYKRTFTKENEQFNDDGIINSESSDKNVYLATYRQRERLKENPTTKESTRNSVISSGTSIGRSKRREVYGNGENTRKRPRFITNNIDNNYRH